MPERHGVVSYPGLVSFISGSYTVSHGISPGVVSIVCPPQAVAPAAGGPVTFSDGLTVVTIPDCKLDSLNVVKDSSGERWILQLFDRRWRWRELGAAKGYYNQPDPHGILYPWTVATPRDLVEFCLFDMGETRYQIDVPNSALPPINWDYQTPAVALQQLCDSLGCRIVYRLDTDSVLITPAGQGGPLPPGALYSDSPGLNLPERPDSIVCVGAPIRWQLRLRLEAVGRDWDGLYRPLDALSYKPANGWGASAPPYFANVTATDRLTRLQALDLAKQTVYRCYRLVNVDAEGTVGIQVPGVGTLTRREQLVLQDTKVEQVQPNPIDERILDADGQRLRVHYYDGFRRDVPAEAFGSRFIGSVGVNHSTNKVQNTPLTSKIQVDFSIDPTWQVVTFSEYVFKVVTTVLGSGASQTTVEPANVFLETGCLVRDPDTHQVIRYERALDLGAPRFGTKPLYVLHEDVQLNVIADYQQVTEDQYLLLGVRDLQAGQGFSLAETLLRSSYYLAGAAARYRVTGAQTRIYNGLVAIPLDGAIQQVTWVVGEPQGAQTTASLNTEHDPYVPPLVARIRAEYAPSAGRRELQVGKERKGPWFAPWQSGVF